jgi:hypothetical protein
MVPLQMASAKLNYIDLIISDVAVFDSACPYLEHLLLVFETFETV